MGKYRQLFLIGLVALVIFGILGAFLVPNFFNSLREVHAPQGGPERGAVTARI